MTTRERAKALLKQADKAEAEAVRLLRAKLPCPHCRCHRSRVVNSRSGSEGDGVWRRRECLACGKRYTTEEVIRGAYSASKKSATISGSR